LTFDIGEEVLVIKKEGDWWTGVIGKRTGMFPANYVQPIDNNHEAIINSTVANDFNSMNINGNNNNISNDVIQETITKNIMSAAEEADARNQADADSEVSQINTQNVVNDVNMQEFRGMTSSAVSSFSRLVKI
jgi:hypothetical protein